MVSTNQRKSGLHKNQLITEEVVRQCLQNLNDADKIVVLLKKIMDEEPHLGDAIEKQIQKADNRLWRVCPRISNKARRAIQTELTLMALLVYVAYSEDDAKE